MTLLVGSIVTRDLHDVPPGHPERHARLVAVHDGIADAHLEGALIDLEVRAAPLSELHRVHDPLYIHSLARLCAAGGGDLDPDTVAAPGSFTTAIHGAGLGLAAIDALRAGRGAAAFVAPRPPGHHAIVDRAMGFCLINNVAVAAAALTKDGERVAIIDWDVHHGNGTQALFWDNPDVLYASLHEWPAYPGTGRAREVGGPRAPGLTVNVPLPSGATGDVALAAIDEVVGPAVDAFSPTWILVSAGFDAHREDPLANLAWSAGDYTLLTQRVLAWARPGRLVAFLEGGYDLDALRHSVHATVAALAGVTDVPEPVTNGGPGRDALRRIDEMRRRAQEGM